MTRPTDDQIRAEVGRTLKPKGETRSVFPSLSFEDGVQMALDWVLGTQTDRPMGP